MRLAGGSDEREEGRTRRHANTRIGTAGCAAMVPGDEPDAGLFDETVLLSGWAAGGVIHGIAALPLSFDGAREDASRIVGGAQEG